MIIKETNYTYGTYLLLLDVLFTKPGVPLRGLEGVYSFLGRRHDEYWREWSNRRKGFALVTSAGSYKNANNDLGGVYNFDNAIQCCAKVFAEGGDAFEYYLNESKDFKVLLCPVYVY